MLLPLLIVFAVALRLAGPLPQAWRRQPPAVALHCVERALNDFTWRAGWLELVALEWAPEPSARELSKIDDARYISGIRQSRVTVRGMSGRHRAGS